MYLNLDLLGQCCVVCPKDLEDFRTAEVIRHFKVFREHLPQFRSAEEESVFFSMRTSPHRCHTIAFQTVERPVDLKGLGFERAFRYLIEYLLGVKRTVIFADACVVTADDLMAASVVLPEECVEQCLTGSCVSHIQGVTGLDARVFHEIEFCKLIDGLNSDLCRDISGL